MNLPIKISAAVFDVDDTLISNYYSDGTGMHEKARYDATRKVADKYGIKDLLEITLEQSNAAPQSAPLHTNESIVWTILRWAGLVNDDKIDYGHKILREIVAEKDSLYREMLSKDGTPIQGAQDFIRHLHKQGDPMGIASGASYDQIKIDFKIIGIDEYIPEEYIISKERIDRPKPNPDPFLKAVNVMDIAHLTDIWAFEDDPKGIISAQDAGLKVCAIASRFSKDDLKQHLANDDIVVDDYSELMGLS